MYSKKWHAQGARKSRPTVIDAAVATADENALRPKVERAADHVADAGARGACKITLGRCDEPPTSLHR